MDVLQNPEAVHSPAHYTKGGLECIQIIERTSSNSEYRGFLLGNIRKYIYRYKYKGNPLQDLKKAYWYLDHLLMYFSDESPTLSMEDLDTCFGSPSLDALDLTVKMMLFEISVDYNFDLLCKIEWCLQKLIEIFSN